MIIEKYGATHGFPISLRSTGNVIWEVRIDNEPVMQNAKTGAALSICLKSSADQTTVRSVLMMGVLFSAMGTLVSSAQK
jgi:hypothetical protein